MINKQEILNKVYTFMMKQNQKCIKPGNDNYQYHYQELRCNAGVLIPIEEYKPEFEDTNLDIIGSEISKYFESKGYEEEDLCWLRDLQFIHDDYEIENWKSEFENFAITHDLILPELN